MCEAATWSCFTLVLLWFYSGFTLVLLRVSAPLRQKDFLSEHHHALGLICGLSQLPVAEHLGIFT
ncbi:hypothetical protein [Deefgea salmonis]|uniref:Uncharacterized protein n=1 Tax=Deefgea salmonis TaxID=2875502 RepID=A0ABS8BPB5_9NEIS|nr:hypothetical protein [Deefgea salmonis]MCB5197567.1 hypothetical protein [Deefgea salmonis]